jgi:hypothetical protein
MTKPSVAISQFYPDWHPANRWNLTGQRVGQTGGFVTPFATCLNS